MIGLHRKETATINLVTYVPSVNITNLSPVGPPVFQRQHKREKEREEKECVTAKKAEEKRKKDANNKKKDGNDKKKDDGDKDDKPSGQRYNRLTIKVIH